ncbi:hypothetical protein DKP76_13535 [Falsochrobactrum shanghaiense]|uniref:Uncharacterized protein n=1 Tax=Falsochrobactrum shanghaiense TaxID=2201899 RepID=A0A316J6V1_9HYPH|nr:hypothetical protein DKP76_13535 [Falsochrobactrum shanghaiense]
MLGRLCEINALKVDFRITSKPYIHSRVNGHLSERTKSEYAIKLFDAWTIPIILLLHGNRICAH